MHLTWKDLAATVFVAAAVVPFVGYMATGSMPFVQDPTGMAAIGLVFGILAAAVGGWIVVRAGTVTRLATAGIALGALAIGVLALVSENFLALAVRQGLLIALLGAMVVLWAVAIMQHAIASAEAAGGSRAAHA